ncbi:MAG: cytidylate kinase family protein [Candidatus Parvarchaeota archaeon]|nr:cytidylate kinase family protein [Candidatus Parvarchaeota archaeon]
MIVIVSGPTASGKTTLAKGLATELNLSYLSGSSKLKELLKLRALRTWESNEGIKAILFRLKNTEFDRKLDTEILKAIKRSDDMVVDSWTVPWLFKKGNALKIYVKAPIEIRALRVSERNGIKYKAALSFTKKKDELTARIYKKLYGIDVLNDVSPFDLVVDSSKLDIDNLRDICVDFIFKFFKV